MTLHRNIELKARLADLAAARVIAKSVATERLGVEHQIDTYFHCPHGRLKLRQINGLKAELVAYQRADTAEARASDYHLVTVADAEALKQALAAALGIRVVVDKLREIYLHHNVRIHLDKVQGLGTFLELEAVLGGDIDDAAGHEQLRRLCREFCVRDADIVPQSYGELLEAATRPGGQG
jgi:adenylate cyclase class 2